MFFSSELLAKRDSGFGLLWLAATLGSKSTFKKLPRRSILTADISQLCNLISEPSEPLALRLSSNLLVGVARVYKIKQEIFMTDVTSCFTSLKKVIQEFKSAASDETRLQMAQPSVRPSAITLLTDPQTTITMDFDALVADWDEYLNIGIKFPQEEGISGDHVTLNVAQGKQSTRPKPAPAETLRAKMHTLTEHYDDLLSASFDLSYYGSGGDGADPSSSHAEVNFVLSDNDNFFAPSDGLDIGGLADELAKELGWSTTPSKNEQFRTKDYQEIYNNANMDIDFDNEQAPLFDDANLLCDDQATPPRTLEKKTTSIHHEENHILFSSHRTTLTPQAPSPTAFSRLLLSQDDSELRNPLQDVTAEEHNQANHEIIYRKTKRTRLLLDARTELTDEELKTARAQYLYTQNSLKHAVEIKQLEKKSSRIIEEMIWGAPSCIHAPTLVDFWQENFKVQAGWSGALQTDAGETSRRKRRKIQSTFKTDEIYEDPFGPNVDMHMDDTYHGPYLRSSEEPGQGRRASRAPSVLEDLGLEFSIQDPVVESQKSSLFPWDNAGGGSSSDAFGVPGSCDIRVDVAGLRFRGSSESRRDSSIASSQIGSLVGLGRSSAPFRRGSQIMGEDYAFEVDMLDRSATLESETNLISLERNSFNFLGYVKMQLRSLSSTTTHLTFDIVVPHPTSTRHVAASAFYHCLVLATKDLLRLTQTNSYGMVIISTV